VILNIKILQGHFTKITITALSELSSLSFDSDDGDRSSLARGLDFDELDCLPCLLRLILVDLSSLWRGRCVRSSFSPLTGCRCAQWLSAARKPASWLSTCGNWSLSYTPALCNFHVVSGWFLVTRSITVTIGLMVYKHSYLSKCYSSAWDWLSNHWCLYTVAKFSRDFDDPSIAP